MLELSKAHYKINRKENQGKKKRSKQKPHVENACKGKQLMQDLLEPSQPHTVILLTSQKLRAQVIWLGSEPAPLEVEIQYLVKVFTSPHVV